MVLIESIRCCLEDVVVDRDNVVTAPDALPYRKARTVLSVANPRTKKSLVQSFSVIVAIIVPATARDDGGSQFAEESVSRFD
jgi:hypothetical protein